jgi:hypothetical protein
MQRYAPFLGASCDEWGGVAGAAGGTHWID